MLSVPLPAVVVDRIQIQQVLVNLIRNAIEAMAVSAPDKRSLSIQARIDGSMVQVRVTDSGCGLDPAMTTRLFEPFQSTKPTGLGLGLAICRTLIEAHGGSIGAAPNPSGGTVFFFLLPVMRNENDP